MTSDFNLQRINTKEYLENLRATIDFGGNLMVFGHRGIGKTQIAKAAIVASGCKELYLNLSLLERPDLLGYPKLLATNANEKFVQFLMPYFYQSLVETDQPVVALLDEVDKVDNGIYAPLLEFTQFHSINGNVFKNLKAVIMTANLIAEGGSRPIPPLLDRAEKFLLEINSDHFLEWGANSGELHPSVSAYLADNREDLCGDVDMEENFSDTSPRGWHNASKLLTFGEKHKWHPQMMQHKVSACIGKKVGIRYSAYFDHYQALLPFIEKIMKGEDSKEFKQFEPSKKLVVCMILCQRFAKMLDHKDEKTTVGEKVSHKERIAKVGSHIAQFLRHKVDGEIVLISLRSQIGAERAIAHQLLDDANWGPILDDLLAKVK